MAPTPLTIISGGQTGVDRAALDVALELGLSCGGYCPQGRRAEDGRIPDRYPLTEVSSPDYADRTRMNAEAAAATLILHTGGISGGTELTRVICEQLGKPLRAVNLATASPDDAADIADWITREVLPRGGVLNVAGPRESESPGIAARAAAFLRTVLAPGKLARTT
jgi:predicted Rossmann-fold nucleotide-binding protein